MSTKNHMKAELFRDEVVDEDDQQPLTLVVHGIRRRSRWPPPTALELILLSSLVLLFDVALFDAGGALASPCLRRAEAPVRDYESVCSYIRRMIHESLRMMSWVVRPPSTPFMIHTTFRTFRSPRGSNTHVS